MEVERARKKVGKEEIRRKGRKSECMRGRKKKKKRDERKWE